MRNASPRPRNAVLQVYRRYDLISNLIDVRRDSRYNASVTVVGACLSNRRDLAQARRAHAEGEKIIRQHPYHASQIRSSSAYLRPILDIPFCHHERWDGRGYPRGLAGAQIPLAARIFAVADAWDALTVGTSDQPAQTREQARAYLRKIAGKIFDPRVVETFLALLDETDTENGIG